MYVVSCVARSLCDELITDAEELHRVCMCLIVCDLESSAIRRWAVPPQKKSDTCPPFIGIFVSDGNWALVVSVYSWRIVEVFRSFVANRNIKRIPEKTKSICREPLLLIPRSQLAFPVPEFSNRWDTESGCVFDLFLAEPRPKHEPARGRCSGLVVL